MSDGGDDRADGGASSPHDTPAPSAPAVLREDQLTNAVAFLSHPKVRSSSAASKREFLQKKGLTQAEIEEAFRRVPQPPPGQEPQPAALPAAAPSAVASTLQHLQPQPLVTYAGQQQGGPAGGYMPPGQHMQMMQQQPQQGVRWTQAVLGAGFVAASAYAAKSLVWPYVEGAYYNWRGHVRPPPRPVDNGEPSASPTAAATQAVAEAIAAQTSELRSSIDSIKQLVEALETSQRVASAADGGAGVGSDGLTVTDLRQELRSFAESLHELASPAPNAAAAPPPKLESELGEIKTLLAELLRSPRSSGEAHSPPPAKGGMAADAATPASVASALPQRTEAAASSAGVNGSAAEQAQHGEAEQPEHHTPQRPAQQQAPPSPGAETPVPPPHPASYMQVLEMLEKGQTPPGIRTDIDDKPPNPNASPPPSKMKPRPKPWERGARGSGIDSGLGGGGGSSSSLASLGAAAETAEAAAPAEGQVAAAEQGLPPVQPAAYAPGSFPSPKRASSIFEAVAPAPESPHIFAGRLSPVRGSSGLGRSDSGVLGGGASGSATGGSSTFAAILAAAQDRATGAAPLTASQEGSVAEGSGIGRPVV
ncbi:Peroxisomal membrane PEX14 [Micractinium conductrix]|uniref:Peroxisomal membrane protein PEX14 n=1 Tax=Micractinium conductrix TaxID=554055 RepID=A0A2P6V6Q9_9CHLO|nr:Peroxisomal membrane PEX14 [Micractinium conductrix]|eukprot:PSC69773.1 Peroxisomal membrane PEX14 [Micractinium conductrix]